MPADYLESRSRPPAADRSSSQASTLQSNRSTTRKRPVSRQSALNYALQDGSQFDDAITSPHEARHLSTSVSSRPNAEFLQLRRELDSKDAYVDHLETSLQSANSQNDILTDRLVASARDARSVQKDADTSHEHLFRVLEKLTRERDDAVAASQQACDKHDALKKHYRAQQEEHTSKHKSWVNEKQQGDTERRRLQNSLHLCESHLEALVKEVNAQRLLQSQREQQPHRRDPIQKASNDNTLGASGDDDSLRSFSTHHHSRARGSRSLQSLRPSSTTPGRQYRDQGVSLADELHAEEEDDFGLSPLEIFGIGNESYFDHRSSPSVHPGRKPTSSISVPAATSVHSKTPYSVSPQQPTRSRPAMSLASLLVAQAERQDSATSGMYHDNGVLHSPNHRHRKAEAMSARRFEETAELMMSADTQMVNEARTNEEGVLTPCSPTSQDHIYTSSDAQTVPNSPLEDATTVAATRSAASSALAVPLIAIHPPLSVPPSPLTAVLPPGTKNAASQTSSPKKNANKDASVQTAKIRLDPRLFGRADSPLTEVNPNQRQQARVQFTLGSDIESLRSRRSVEEQTRLLSRDAPKSTTSARSQRLKAINLPSPTLRASPMGVSDDTNPRQLLLRQEASRFANSSTSLSSFDEISYHDSDSTGDEAPPAEARVKIIGGGQTDQRFYNAVSATAVLKDLEVSPRGGPLDSTDSTSDKENATSIEQSIAHHQRDVNGSTASCNVQTNPTGTRMHHPRNSIKDPLILSNPISNFNPQPSPLPIPRRSSKRLILDTSSDEMALSAQYPFSTDPRRVERLPPVHRGSTGWRKGQSINTARSGLSNSPARRRRKASNLSPITSSANASPISVDSAYTFDLHDQHVVSTPMTDMADPTIGVPNRVDVEVDDRDMDDNLIDAIASIMIGEWMWKYVHKRRSLGMGDASNSVGDDIHSKDYGIRHKRWMWVSPYERTIMWSAKQPASETALLGRRVRKLPIKSILDVKDGNPFPGGKGEIYDRSIVVLTSSRTLKFTAPDRERHYLWLMALSYLSNPSQIPPQVSRTPEASRKTTARAKREMILDRRNSVIERSIDKLQNRTSNESVKLRWSGTAASRKAAEPAIEHDMPMRPLETYARHTRKRSSTALSSRTSSSIAGPRGSTSLVSPSSPRIPSSPHPRSASVEGTSLPAKYDLGDDNGMDNGRSGGNSNSNSNSNSRDSHAGSMMKHRTPKFHEEDMGTVRMEAFVDTRQRVGVLDLPASRIARPAVRTRQGSTGSRRTVRPGAAVGNDDVGPDQFRGF